MEETADKLVVVDTSIFIDFLRGHQPALTFFETIPTENRTNILFSAITESELIAGKSCNENEIRTAVLNMLNSFSKIEVDNPIACKAGDLCRSHDVALPDAVIAATAISNKATLLTKNLKDFNKIKNLKTESPY